MSAISNADVTARLEGGVAVPLTEPQSDRFDVGGHGAVKGMFWINSIL